jgi:hypothetical protein
MRARIAGAALVLIGTLAARTAKEQKPAEARGENESVVINATLYSTPEEVKQVLGSDLNGHYIVVAVQVTPRFGKEVEISRDDFLLRTDKDGEKSPAFAPSQIAGRGAIVISQTGGGAGGPTWDNRGPILGGYPGQDAPHRVGGDSTTIGPGPEAEGAQGKLSANAKSKDSPMLAVLKQKELPQTKTSQPVSGLLYFAMEKQKVKDLELRYNITDDKIYMRFHVER